jgi:hypothetical protein
MIRAIEYASCYVYSPAGTGAVCERSRLLRALLKAGDANFMLKYALRVRQQVTDSPLLAGFFGPSDVLIPVRWSMKVWEALRGRACAVCGPCASLRRLRPVNGQPCIGTTSPS